MTRFKSTFRLALAMLLTTTAISLAPMPAQAWEWVEWDQGNGVNLWVDKGSDGQTKFAVTIEKDGKFEVYFDGAVVDAVFDKIQGKSNPNPEDNSSKSTEKPDVAELLKKLRHASLKSQVNVENSPLGKYIGGEGSGYVPHWNPGDDEDKGTGPSGKDNKAGGLTPEQIKNIERKINAAAHEARLIGESMGDGTEGGSESAPILTKHGSGHSGGQGNGDGEGDGSGKNSDKEKLPKGENLGPRPDLINPAPELKGHGAAAVKTKSLGTVSAKNKTDSKTAKTSDVMSPGLLEGGGGFSVSGPSATGAVHSGGAARLR